jgi:hypothetical protein
LRTKDGFDLTDVLEIHVIELPKYVESVDNRNNRSALEQLRLELGDPLFQKAIGVLEMIQRTPDKRRQYDDRIKLERDQEALLRDAIEEGEARGEAIGKAAEKMNMIQMFQSLLQAEPTSPEVLHSLSLEMLDELILELKSQLSRRIV